jgi:hypothetical protein
MSDLNGRPLSPRRIPKRANWSNAGRVVLTKLLEVPLPVRLAFWLTLLVLTGLLAGCAGLSTPPSETPRNPSLPPPQQSQPTEPYLSRVLRNIELWDKRLRDTLPTP